MKVIHGRTGRSLTLATATMLFGSDRDGVEEAFPGDVIGLNNPAGGLFQIGDALHTGSSVAFEPIPSFRPRSSATSGRQKSARRGNPSPRASTNCSPRAPCND